MRTKKFIALLVVLNSLPIYAQLSGVYTVGSLGGEDYSSITNSGGFFDAINSNGLSGNVTLKVTSDLNAESGNFSLNSFAGGYQIKIIPNSASLKTIKHSSCNDDLITLDGADNVIIDGRYGGVGQFLKFTSNCNDESVINLINDCQKVTIRNTILLSDNNQSSYNSGGAIRVDEDQNVGCDSLQIINNNIADFTGPIDLFDAIQVNAPKTSSGVLEGLKICGNHMYNANGKGVFIIANDGRVEQAEILRNSFYATGTVTGPGNGWAYAIVQIESGGGHVIRANHFGGTAPMCGGGKMDIQLTSGSVLMTMIRMTDDLNNVAINKIDSNIFRNLSIVNGTSNKMGAVFIRIEKGNYAIGSADANVFGNNTTDATLSSNASIYIESKDATNDSYFCLLKSSTDGTIEVENNKAGSIHLYNAINTDLAAYFYFSDGSSVNFVNNKIGGVTNSIVKSARASFKLFYLKGDPNSFEVTSNVISGVTSDAAFEDDFYAIHVRDGSGAPTIKKNTIEDVSIIGTAQEPRFYGIRVDNKNALIDSNRIQNITLDSRYTTRQFAGIYCNESSNTATISNNLISDVKLLNTSLNVGAVGIYTNGGSSHYMIKNNKLEKFEIYSTSTSAYMRMIQVNSATQNTIQNNVVLIDNNNRVSNMNIYGIYDYNSNSSGWTRVWHNTIDIRGTCNGTRRTACYYKSQGGDRNVQNNIFNNRRVRTSGNGDNFAMYFSSTSGTLICDYNLLYVEDDFDELVHRSSDKDFTGWQALGYGANSVTTITPQALVNFTTGKQLTLLGNDKGVTNLGIAWDYEYSSRPQDAGFDMGAFELSSNTLMKPLPVEMIAFQSYCEHDGVNLNWTTASEVNNSHFTISRSQDSKKWQFLKEIPGSGNSSVQRNYSCSVENNDANNVWYYKIDQTDFDGKTTTLKIDVIYCDGSNQSCITVGPNPSTSPNINLKLDGCFYNKEVSVKVVDAVGRVVYSNTTIWNQRDAITIQLNDVSTKGIYFVVASTKEAYVSEKLIVQ